MDGLFKGNLGDLETSKQVIYDHVEAQDVYIIYLEVQTKVGKKQSVSLHLCWGCRVSQQCGSTGVLFLIPVSPVHNNKKTETIQVEHNTLGIYSNIINLL